MALNKIYSTIKANITMFALIPTITGGMWQTVKLLNISPNMIRFFSLSQMISDSVLIILYFLIPLIGFLILLFDVVYDEQGNSHYNDYEKSTLFKKAIILTFFLIIFISSIHLDNKITIDSNLLLLWSLFAITGLFSLLRYCLIKLLRKSNTSFSFFIAIFFSCNFFIVSSSIDNITKDLKDIKNFSDLIDKMEKEKCYSKRPQIIYFNDKYIFLEIEIKSKKTFIIKKLEDIFVN